MNYLSELKEKLKQAKAGWNYLWNLLEKETKRQNFTEGVLMELYRCQVELESARHKLKNYEKKLENINLTKEDEDIVREGLANYMSTFQAMAFSIENLLRG